MPIHLIMVNVVGFIHESHLYLHSIVKKMDLNDGEEYHSYVLIFQTIASHHESKCLILVIEKIVACNRFGKSNQTPRASIMIFIINEWKSKKVKF